MKTKE